MGSDKFNELSDLITSAEKAIEGFNKTNKDEVKGEIIRINDEIGEFKSKYFTKDDLTRLDKLDDIVFELLNSNKNELYNESLIITREDENDNRSISKMVSKISALIHGVRYPKTESESESDVQSETRTITGSIDKRISTLEEQVKELQTIVKTSRGGKTRRKRSRKSKKSRRR